MSFIEHIAGEYYKKMGYIVVPRLKYPSEKWGWKDIDLVAFNENEILAIECKAGEKNHTKMAEKIIKDYAQIDKYIDEKIPLAKGKTKKHILIVSFTLSPKTVEENLRSNGIDIEYLKNLLKKFLKLLQKEIEETGRKGKEEDYVTRTLKELIRYELIKDDIVS